MNGQDYAAQAKRIMDHADSAAENMGKEWYALEIAAAQVHATLAVAYAQAGAWKDTPTVASRTCGDTWNYLDGRAPLGCVRVLSHDGDHVTGDGIVWNRKGPNPETLVIHPLHPDDPRNMVTTHVRVSTAFGPDFCKPCSDAIGEWVPWPCAGSFTSGTCGVGDLGCCRARGHDGDHVAADGVSWRNI